MCGIIFWAYLFGEKCPNDLIVHNSCQLIMQVWVCRPRGEGGTESRPAPCWSSGVPVPLLDVTFSNNRSKPEESPSLAHNVLDLRPPLLDLGEAERNNGPHAGWGPCAQGWLLESLPCWVTVSKALCLSKSQDPLFLRQNEVIRLDQGVPRFLRDP